MSTTTRVGKIARLPHTIRQELNERLADGEPGDPLLAWLNALPAVQKILQTQFEGQPINHQNLSNWRQGGYVDWERLQLARDRVRASLGEAAQIRADLKACQPRDASHNTGQLSFLDHIGDAMALSMLELFRETESGDKGAERTRHMLEISRELTRLSHSEQQRQRTFLLHERWKGELHRRQVSGPDQNAEATVRRQPPIVIPPRRH